MRQRRTRAGIWIFVLAVAMLRCYAQQAQQADGSPSGDAQQINVNWLYGAYVPRDVPMKPLTGHERLHLYIRQTFTTPGIYVKTALFSARDQIANSPPEWDGGIAGYGKRLASRQ